MLRSWQYYLRFTKFHITNKHLIFNITQINLACGGYGESFVNLGESFVTKFFGESFVNLKSVERFDSRVGEWQNASMLHSPRYWAAAASLNGEVYVAGGWNEDGDPLETIQM